MKDSLHREENKKKKIKNNLTKSTKFSKEFVLG